MKNSVLITIIVAIVVGGTAFFGGMKYQQSKAVGNGFGRGQFGQFQRTNGGQRIGGAGGGRPVTGEIVSEDTDSVTVKLQDGSSKIVNIAKSTTFSKTDTAAKSDLKVGEQIAAFGTDNSDGSVTAQNVQLNPMFRIGQGSPRPTQ